MLLVSGSVLSCVGWEMKSCSTVSGYLGQAIDVGVYELLYLRLGNDTSIIEHRIIEHRNFIASGVH